MPRRERNHYAEHNAIDHLRKNHVRNRAGVCLPAQNGQRPGGQHIAHGVVAAAFDLEQGCRAVLEVQLFGAQDGENRCRIGRGYDRTHQHADEWLEAQHKMAEQRSQPRRQRNPRRGQQHRLIGDRLGARPFGAKTTIKHNENQRKGANLFSKEEIFKGDFQDTVRAEQHPKQDERGKHGNAQPIGNPVKQDAEQHHERA